MKTYEVWVGGYAATGESGPAQFVGMGTGKNFSDACKDALIKNKWDLYYFRAGNSPTYWGCYFYDNERAARKFYG